MKAIMVETAFCLRFSKEALIWFPYCTFSEGRLFRTLFLVYRDVRILKVSALHDEFRTDSKKGVIRFYPLRESQDLPATLWPRFKSGEMRYELHGCARQKHPLS